MQCKICNEISTMQITKPQSNVSIVSVTPLSNIDCAYLPTVHKSPNQYCHFCSHCHC